MGKISLFSKWKSSDFFAKECYRKIILRKSENTKKNQIQIKKKYDNIYYMEKI